MGNKDGMEETQNGRGNRYSFQSDTNFPKLCSIFFISPIAILPYEIIYNFYRDSFILRVISILIGALIVYFFVNRFIESINIDISKECQQNRKAGKRYSQKYNKSVFEIQYGHPVSNVKKCPVFFRNTVLAVVAGYLFSMFFWRYMLSSVDPFFYFSSIGRKVYQAITLSTSSYGKELNMSHIENILYFFVSLFIPGYKLYRKIHSIE